MSVNRENSMSDSSNSHLFSDEEPLVKCDGCGKYFEKTKLKECRVCRKMFCSECQKTHDCVTDPLVGKWKSELGTSKLEIASDGSAIKTVFGVKKKGSWYKISTSVYSINGGEYTRAGSHLHGRIVDYAKLD